MRLVLTILLVALFGYALALVMTNNIPTQVNLLFTQVPAMSLGLLLIITLVLGLLIGLLLGLQVFRVFQMHWEISHLKKELTDLRKTIQVTTGATVTLPNTVPADKLTK